MLVVRYFLMKKGICGPRKIQWVRGIVVAVEEINTPEIATKNYVAVAVMVAVVVKGTIEKGCAHSTLALTSAESKGSQWASRLARGEHGPLIALVNRIIVHKGVLDLPSCF